VGAELVQASTNRPFWSEAYQRSSGDVFTMQAEILRAVAEAIRVPYRSKRAYASPTRVQSMRRPPICTCVTL
jgi:hypothetical protein